MDKKINSSCGVDWLRVQCLFGNFNIGCGLNNLELQLLNVLKLNPLSYDLSERNVLGKYGYDSTYLFGEDVLIGAGVRESAKVKGVDTQFIFDLSGGACRNFEQRGGSWIALFEFLSRNFTRVKRIDLFMDSINNEMTIGGIKEKIEKGLFTCPFRAFKATGKRGDEMYKAVEPSASCGDDSFVPLVLDTRKGYSCTFGNHGSSEELQIYDKSCERQSKNIGISTSNWVRFEARFSGNRSDYVVKNLVCSAMKNGNFGSVVAGLIGSLVDFKEVCSDSDIENRHLNRCDDWKPYVDFLGGVKALKVPCCQAKVENNLTRSMGWAKRDWVSTLFKMFGVGDFCNSDLLSSMIDTLKDKGFSMADLESVKNYCRSNNLPVPSYSQILDNVQMFLDSMCPKNCVDLKSMFLSDYKKKRFSDVDDCGSDSAIDLSGLD